MDALDPNLDALDPNLDALDPNLDALDPILDALDPIKKEKPALDVAPEFRGIHSRNLTNRYQKLPCLKGVTFFKAHHFGYPC